MEYGTKINNDTVAGNPVYRSLKIVTYLIAVCTMPATSTKTAVNNTTHLLFFMLLHSHFTQFNIPICKVRCPICHTFCAKGIILNKGVPLWRPTLSRQIKGAIGSVKITCFNRNKPHYMRQNNFIKCAS